MSQLSTIFRNYTDAFGFLAAEGYMYRAGPAAAGTTVTGATSLATSTPTFLLKVSAGTNYAVIPAECRLFQAGTVAGGAITIVMEMDNANRYTSGGTEMTYQNARTAGQTLPTGINFYSATSTAIVATDAYGVQMDARLLGQDVSPAEGAQNEYLWTPQAGPDVLVPTSSLGASWLVNTSAATTGPTWHYAFKFAVVPLDWLT